MVRQDKISYLLTGFHCTGNEPIYPDEPLIDLFIRTILSQGTTDELCDFTMNNLQLKFISWEDILTIGQPELANMINVCGLANQKSNSIINLLKWVKSTFNKMDMKKIQIWNSERIYKELTSIQGIDLKTASIFICIGLRRDVFPVDIHVHRILIRIGVTSIYTNPDKIYKLVNPFIPVGKEFFLYAHLIEHGKFICKSSNPKCNSCMFNEHCDYFIKKNEWVTRAFEA